MIRSYRQIIGNPIVCHEDGRLLALVQDLIIDSDTGKIEGLWVKPLTIPLKNGVIQSEAILEWKKNIYIKDESEIAEPEDIIRIYEILSRNTYFTGNKVKNENGDMLGRVFDLDFDTNKLFLKNIYVQKSFLGLFRYNARIFSYDSILKVLPEYILVKDTEEKKIKEAAIIKDKQPLLDV